MIATENVHISIEARFATAIDQTVNDCEQDIKIVFISRLQHS